MKSSTMRLMIAAAALAVAAGSAFAQTYKAEIPVTFRANGTLMLPGSYEVNVSRGFSGITLVTVNNLDEHKRIFVKPTPGNDAPKAWKTAGKPVIGFECVEGRCVLRSLWNGSDVATYRFPGSITPRSDSRASLMVVKLTEVE